MIYTPPQHPDQIHDLLDNLVSYINDEQLSELDPLIKIEFINQIRMLILETKQKMRSDLPKVYSQKLLNNLFFHPYIKVQFVVDQLAVSRITATKYLNELADHGIVSKHKMGRTIP